MKTVPLYGKKAAGRFALVDDEDYDLVMQHRWHVHEFQRASGSTHGPYAKAGIWEAGKVRTIQMHKLITGWPMTDHINHDGLDNRRVNLRPATAGQNGANRRKGGPGISRFKGVSLDRRTGHWSARLLVKLGTFPTEEEAARAYDDAMRRWYGEYAYTNFTEAGIPRVELAVDSAATGALSCLGAQDLLRAFIDSECSRSGDVPVRTLHQAWSSWCLERGSRPGSVNAFGRELREIIPDLIVATCKRPVNHRRYRNLSLNESRAVDAA